MRCGQRAMMLGSEEHLRRFENGGSRFRFFVASDDFAAIYNILYRQLFDRHRDMPLPTSFLINAKGDIVKVYQGPVDPEHVEQDFRHIPTTGAERLARGLPFPERTDTLGRSDATIFRSALSSFSVDIWIKRAARSSLRLATIRRALRPSTASAASI